ncbi:MAG: hypothetical protein ABI216_05325 [Devosia sp.]
MLKQIFLAIILVAVPVAAFTGYQVYARSSVTTVAGLGDLSSLKTIVADAQNLATKGDLPATAKRMTDWESAWDAGETAMRPLNQTYWGNIDAASDGALHAVRVSTPKPDDVKQALDALMAALNDPSKSV